MANSTVSSTEASTPASPLDDPEERRVLYAALDSFRCVVFHYATSLRGFSISYLSFTHISPSHSLTLVLVRRQYRQAAHYNITHLRRQSFYSLPTAHMDILCEPPFSIPQTFDAVDEGKSARYTTDVRHSKAHLLHIGQP